MIIPASTIQIRFKVFSIFERGQQNGNWTGSAGSYLFPRWIRPEISAIYWFDC
jgi:hypothetical protein